MYNLMSILSVDGKERHYTTRLSRYLCISLIQKNFFDGHNGPAEPEAVRFAVRLCWESWRVEIQGES
jgi:hypothetical protein